LFSSKDTEIEHLNQQLRNLERELEQLEKKKAREYKVIIGNASFVIF
jgi:hypothetical protein